MFWNGFHKIYTRIRPKLIVDSCVTFTDPTYTNIFFKATRINDIFEDSWVHNREEYNRNAIAFWSEAASVVYVAHLA